MPFLIWWRTLFLREQRFHPGVCEQWCQAKCRSGRRFPLFCTSESSSVFNHFNKIFVKLLFRKTRLLQSLTFDSEELTFATVLYKTKCMKDQQTETDNCEATHLSRRLMHAFLHESNRFWVEVIERQIFFCLVYSYLFYLYKYTSDIFIQMWHMYTSDMCIQM